MWPICLRSHFGLATLIPLIPNCFRPCTETVKASRMSGAGELGLGKSPVDASRLETYHHSLDHAFLSCIYSADTSESRCGTLDNHRPGHRSLSRLTHSRPNCERKYRPSSSSRIFHVRTVHQREDRVYEQVSTTRWPNQVSGSR